MKRPFLTIFCLAAVALLIIEFVVPALRGKKPGETTASQLTADQAWAQYAP